VNGRWYWPLLWIVLAGGLIPAAWFTWTWRPRRRWSPRQLDAGGWVHVILALYLLSAFRLATGQSKLPDSVPEALFGLVIGAGIDVVLWVRVTRWLEFRRGAQPLTRHDDPEA
jgi:hypothetical protein